MKTIVFLLLLFSNVFGYSQTYHNSQARGEFYEITEAYLFIGDSIYTMKEEYVDVPSRVFIMFRAGYSPDSSLVISIEHGSDKVLFLGFAEEVESPGNFDFLPGKKTYYYWKYNVHNKKEPGECFVIKEYTAKKESMPPEEYYRFHFLFEEEKFMFYCDIPVIHFLSREDE